jgi:hypothetical protein
MLLEVLPANASHSISIFVTNRNQDVHILKSLSNFRYIDTLSQVVRCQKLTLFLAIVVC